jgi:hypothetical protein
MTKQTIARLWAWAGQSRLRDNPAARPAQETVMPTPETTFLRLRDLHQAYVEKVNRLVAEDREDLIPKAISAYADEALREITADKAA